MLRPYGGGGHDALMRTEEARVWRSSGPTPTRRGRPRSGIVGRYARADLIFVTGTAPVAEDGGVFAPGDPYAQARHCLELIERALRNLDSDRTAIVRTRMFVTDIERWAEFGRAHREFFGDSHPTTTMVEISRLMAPGMLIEIEADAVAPAA